MPWIMSISAIFVAILLAVRGWILLMRLARRREAYDLYCSAVANLQQLEDEGIKAWLQRVSALDDNTVRRLTMKLAYFEKMLDLLMKHYYKKSNMRKDIEEDIQIFRMCLTQNADSLPANLDRSDAIHDRAITMMGKLLDANYAYINKRPWRLCGRR